jgi:hypothetical protein
VLFLSTLLLPPSPAAAADAAAAAAATSEKQNSGCNSKSSGAETVRLSPSKECVFLRDRATIVRDCCFTYPPQ